jgi:hypothetical protein
MLLGRVQLTETLRGDYFTGRVLKNQSGIGMGALRYR